MGLLEVAFVLLSCYLTFVKMSRRPWCNRS